jgi:hypothetical protein
MIGVNIMYDKLNDTKMDIIDMFCTLDRLYNEDNLTLEQKLEFGKTIYDRYYNTPLKDFVKDKFIYYILPMEWPFQEGYKPDEFLKAN